MRAPLIALLACLLPLGAAAEVKDSSANGFTLENRTAVDRVQAQQLDGLVQFLRAGPAGAATQQGD